MQKPNLLTLPYSISVCRLSPEAPLPGWAVSGEFFAITRTEQELSVVCEAQRVPPDVQQSPGWRGLRVEGTLDFSLIGVLAGISGVLSQAGISLFAISTYDTDHILVREEDLTGAVETLRAAGYSVHGG